MDKYRLVQDHAIKGDAGGDSNENSNSKKDSSATMSCEVRITQQGKPRNYISYAMKLFVRCCTYRTIGTVLCCAVVCF